MHCARVCVCMAWCNGEWKAGKEEKERRKERRPSSPLVVQSRYTMDHAPASIACPQCTHPLPFPSHPRRAIMHEMHSTDKKKESKQTATTYPCPLYHIQPCYPSYPPPNFAHTHTAEDIQTCDPCNPCSPCNHVTMQPCNHATMYIHSHSSFFLSFSHA